MGTDPDVVDCACDSPNLRTPMPETTTDQMCMWRGPALDSNGGDTEDQLREMILQRVENQEGQMEEVGEPTPRYRQEYWNEIILDAEVMRRELERNPRAVVAAFMYIRGQVAGRSMANRMASSW